MTDLSLDALERLSQRNRIFDICREHCVSKAQSEVVADAVIAILPAKSPDPRPAGKLTEAELQSHGDISSVIGARLAALPGRLIDCPVCGAIDKARAEPRPLGEEVAGLVAEAKKNWPGTPPFLIRAIERLSAERDAMEGALKKIRARTYSNVRGCVLSAESVAEICDIATAALQHKGETDEQG